MVPPSQPWSHLRWSFCGFVSGCFPARSWVWRASRASNTNSSVSVARHRDGGGTSPSPRSWSFGVQATDSRCIGVSYCWCPGKFSDFKGKRSSMETLLVNSFLPNFHVHLILPALNLYVCCVSFLTLICSKNMQKPWTTDGRWNQTLLCQAHPQHPDFH